MCFRPTVLPGQENMPRLPDYEPAPLWWVRAVHAAYRKSLTNYYPGTQPQDPPSLQAQNHPWH
jgi:hypothetical protein